MKKLLLLCAAALLATMSMSVERKEMKKVDFPQQEQGLAGIRELGVRTTKKVQKAVSAVDPGLYEGRTFHANLVNSDAWEGYEITSVPYGVYSYTLGDDADFSAVSTDLGYNFMSSVYMRDQLLGVYPMSIMGILNGVRYEGLTAPDFKTSWEKVYENASYGYIPTVMAYEPTEDRVYAAMYNDALNGLNWAVYNKTNQSFDIKQKWVNDFQPVAMAATPEGRLFCIGLDGFYYELDKATGEAEMLGEMDLQPANYVQAMGYDARTATFLWCAVTNYGSALYAVEVETGAMNKIADLTKSEQVSSLFFMENEAPDKAPAAIADLDIAYSANGALDGNITFTIPDKAYDGSALTGNLDMTLYVDGEVKENKSVAPGEKQTYSVSLANDNHYVYVLLENEAGISPYNFLYEYAGYDVPKAVTDVVLEISKDGESKLTWTAPAGGVNGGYIDYDNLTYTVVRMPEGVVVADGLKETTFEEVCPVAMARYSYQVIPHNGADKQGEAAVSNQVLYGSAFSVPYHDDFATNETMTFYSFYNEIEENNRSAYNESQKTVDLKNQNTWLITPPVAMEAGKAYCATYTMRNSFEADSVEIYMGTDVNDMESFRLVNTIDSMATLDYTYYDPFESDFVIDEDGDYYVAVVARKNWIFIKQIDVEEIGSKDAPAAPASLAIVPDETGEMKAALSFVMPTKTMGGGDITGTMSAAIYRDNGTEAVGTLTDLAAGASAAWTDESVEGVGKHTYTVRAVNAAGEGKQATAEAFIGVYIPPYTNTFDDKESTELFVTENLEKAETADCRWQFSGGKLALGGFGYSVQNPVEYIRLYMPAFKLEKDEVYELSFKWSHSVLGGECPAYVTMGLQPNAEAQADTIGSLPATAYGAGLLTRHEIVTDASGKHFLTVQVEGRTQGDYLMSDLDSLVIRHITSAFAPYSVGNLKAEHHAEGKLEATLTFTAPTVDFAGRTLSENIKIDVFRGTESTIPVKTFEDVAPGEALTWTDTEPKQGVVTYLVVPSNAAGRGKETIQNTYVGIDLPQAVTGYVVKGDADNTGVELSWTAPEVGINGGVLDESLEYIVVEYFPTEQDPEKMMEIIGTTKETSFSKAAVELESQKVHYYGIISTTTTGIGQAVLGYTVLGKLYDLPFKESFANGAASTAEWMIGSDNQQAAVWYAGVDDEQYTSQDGDNGFGLFINGVMMGSMYYTGTFTTPKFHLAANGNTLTFWAYHGIASESMPRPSLIVRQNINDGEYVDVSDSIFVSEGAAGWQQYSVPLEITPDARYSTLQFKAGASNYTEWILIDNITVDAGISDVPFVDGEEGVVYGLKGAIAFTGLGGKELNVYDVSGVRIASFVASDYDVRNFAPGVYVVGYNDGVCKVVVR